MIKRLTAFFALAVLATFAFAGDKKHCQAGTEACAKEIVAKYRTHGWIGLDLENTGKEYFSKVTKVHPESPAAAAGFQEGDILVAINGVYLTAENKDSLKQIKQGFAVGKQVTYTVKRPSGKQKITATLVAPPDEVVAAWLGKHILSQHLEDVEVASN